MKLKAGIIGLGKMGLSHAAIVGPHPSVDMVAVCDTSSLVLDVFRKFSRINVYTDYSRMIAQEKLDFIVVATPTRLHYPMVKHALEQGINVFCEKPFCLTTEEGNELVELAKRKGLINQVSYHNRFVGTFRELKRLLDNRVLGDIIHFTGEAYGSVITNEKGSSWRSDPREGGGCLMDYASHVINLIQEIIGRPVLVKGSVLKNIYSRDVDDAVYSMLVLGNGLSGILSVNWCDSTYRKMTTSLTVYGKKGKIFCDATEIRIYLNDDCHSENLPKGWTIKYLTELAIPVNFYLRGEEYSAQIDHFVNCIIGKKSTEINSFEQALYTDKVIEMITADSKK
ncbi:MAG: Gfo/Idh/MocA family oxidoreductase [Bacteroidota bacterium]|nr:Gfo/Idh/MocA family oxidoreductase [Bacteroidota bacterium]